MTGKQIRMSKIINPTTNRTCIVPMDHGITVGPIQGLTHTKETVKSIVESGVDAVILHKGMFPVLCEDRELLARCNLLLHLSASTSLSQEPGRKRLVSTVEQALKMGALGVSVHVNIGPEFDGQMIADLGEVSDACMTWGMPLIAMMYMKYEEPGGLRSSGHIAHIARIAQELGADMVKVDCPQDPEEIENIVNSVGIPVIISGGARMSVEMLLKKVDGALKAGVRGVAIGRNIFQSRTPGLIVDLVYRMVHQQLSLDNALNAAREYGLD